jgi:hypothetical protein
MGGAASTTTRTASFTALSFGDEAPLPLSTGSPSPINGLRAGLPVSMVGRAGVSRLSVAQSGNLHEEDAVLVVATICSAAEKSRSADVPSAQLRATWLASACVLDGVVCVAKYAFANVLQQAGWDAKRLLAASVLPTHLKVCGFSTEELRLAGLSTQQLVGVGAQATALLQLELPLAELCEHGLALELAAAGGASLDDLRAAAAGDVPAAEKMEATVAMVEGADALPSVFDPGGAKKGEVVQRFENEGILAVPKGALPDDGAGEALLWVAATSPAIGRLKELALLNNGLGVRAATALGHILRFSLSLTAVDLHNNELGDEGARVIGRALAFSQSLQVLRVSGNGVDEPGAVALYEGCTRNATLVSLTVDRDPIPLGEVKGYRGAGKHALDLSSRGFGSLSALIIARLIKDTYTGLTKLVLDHNPLEASGAAEVAALLRDHRALKELHMRYTGIYAGGGVALADALRVNTSLERLILVSCLIGSEGALAFHRALSDGNSSLRLLDLHQNRLSDQTKASLEALAARRPSLRIEL